MITAILLLQAAQTDSPPPAVEAQPAVQRSAREQPELPHRPWVGMRSREAASRYWQCRRRDIGGMLFAEEGVDPRADVWRMIYDRKVQCRTLRTQLLIAFDRDLRAWAARTPDGHTDRWESEWALDLFEQAINNRIFSGFAL